ncbi:MAG: hypothetical protein AAGA56_14850 [Myxococcota bacterium]
MRGCLYGRTLGWRAQAGAGLSSRGREQSGSDGVTRAHKSLRHRIAVTPSSVGAVCRRAPSPAYDEAGAGEEERPLNSPPEEARALARRGSLPDTPRPACSPTQRRDSARA